MTHLNQTAETTLGTWTTTTSLPATVYASQAVVTKNRVYLLRGNGSSTVYTAPINQDGTIGEWATANSLPATVVHSQAIVTKTQVYLLSGYINGSISSTVYTAPINPDGTIGTWTTSTPLPSNVTNTQAIVIKNRAYLLGGYTGSSYSSTVYTAPINPDGTLGAWTTSSPLPATVSWSRAIVTKNRVYLLGGYINDTPSSAVFTAPINPDGTLGAWTTSNSLPATVAHSRAIVTKTKVYLLGGYINDSISSTVYTAPINEDGTIGEWTTSASLPGTVSDSQAIVTQNRVYLLGGHTGDASSATVFTTSINPEEVTSESNQSKEPL